MIFAQIQDNEAAISAKDNLDPKYGACLARPFNFNNPNYNPFTHCEDCGMEIEKLWKGDHSRICGIQLETSHINNPKNYNTSDIDTASTNIAYFSEPKLTKQLPQQPNSNTSTPLIDTALPETINLITLESPPPSHKNPNPLQTPSPNLGLKQTATQKPENNDEMSERNTSPVIFEYGPPELFMGSSDSDTESEYVKTPLGYWQEKSSVSKRDAA